MEKNLKEQIVKSATAVKRKVNMIKDAKNSNAVTLETIFKPIVEPLNLIANKNNENFYNEEMSYKPLLKKIKNNESEKSYSSTEDFNEPVSEQEGEKEPDKELYEKSNKTLIASPSDEHDTSESSFKSIQSPPNIKNPAVTNA